MTPEDHGAAERGRTSLEAPDVLFLTLVYQPQPLQGLHRLARTATATASPGMAETPTFRECWGSSRARPNIPQETSRLKLCERNPCTFDDAHPDNSPSAPLGTAITTLVARALKVIAYVRRRGSRCQFAALEADTFFTSPLAVANVGRRGAHDAESQEYSIRRRRKEVEVVRCIHGMLAR
ncbi:hypothetical protein OH76DRAFT_1238239 [Lentinus brumalis]|uniref:Uncharacterized protein n=1 Tax=Lentinus brumalis TaxID=2498619 RepID=A0A371CS29_9APHY|nr:hypothetical protein OH76DRAFT_1238239 [Polyporus brumalis]